MRSRLIKIVLGVIVGVLCLWLVVDRVALERVGETLWSADLGLLAVAVVALLGAQAARAGAWVALARPKRPLSFWLALRLLLIGNLGNLVIPMRGGELARVWLLGVRGEVGTGHAATVVMIERTIDMLVLFCLVAAASVIVGMPGWVGSSALRLLAAALVALVGLVTLYLLRRQLRGVSRRVATLRLVGPPLGRLSKQFLDGLELLRARSAVAAAGSLILSWALVLVGLELRLRAFGVSITAGAPVVVLAVTNVALSVPVVPAGVGVYEYATVLGLEALGVDQARALAFAVASHALTLLLLALCGVVALVIDQLLRGRQDPSGNQEPDHAEASGG